MNVVGQAIAVLKNARNGSPNPREAQLSINALQRGMQDGSVNPDIGGPLVDALVPVANGQPLKSSTWAFVQGLASGVVANVEALGTKLDPTRENSLWSKVGYAALALGALYVFLSTRK